MSARGVHPNTDPSQLAIDLGEVLATPAGARVLYWIMAEVCRLWQPSFDPDRKYGIGEHAAYIGGIRAVGITLMGKLQTLAPRAYVKMLDEQARDFERKLAAAAADKQPASRET